MYQSQGFTLTATSTPFNPPNFAYLGIQSPFSPGVTALFHHISLGEITLTRSNGGAFDLLSIDLAELPGGDTHGQPVRDPPFPLTFTGIRIDGTVVTETVTIDSFLTLKTYSLTQMNGVISVSWFQGGGPPDSPTHQFDNLVVSPEATSAPEPHSLALFNVGFAGLIAWYLVKGRHGKAQA